MRPAWAMPGNRTAVGMRRCQWPRGDRMKRPVLSLAFAPDQPSPRHADILVRKGNAPPRRVRFESDGPALRRSGDALLCLGLIPAMEIAAPLHITPPPGQALADRAAEIANRLAHWYPGLSPLAWSAAGRLPPSPNGGGTALFFSGGVDSAYSLDLDRARVGTLITLVGADVAATETDRVTRLCRTTRAVAEAEGMRHIVITTDIRSVSDRMIGWVEYHGAVLAAVAHLLGDEVGHCLIASSADQATYLRPWGTHPDLDPLWASETVSFEHHALAPRFSKIARILHRPHLMAGLRVCDHDDANCGTCPDCVFMLNALAVLDGFGRAPTYDRADFVDGHVIADGRGTRTDLLDMRAAAVANGKPADLPRAIDRAIAAFDRRDRLVRALDLATLQRKFKRWKRRRRYLRAAAAPFTSRGG